MYNCTCTSVTELKKNRQLMCSWSFRALILAHPRSTVMGLHLLLLLSISTWMNISDCLTANWDLNLCLDSSCLLVTVFVSFFFSFWASTSDVSCVWTTGWSNQIKSIVARNLYLKRHMSLDHRVRLGLNVTFTPSFAEFQS